MTAVDLAIATSPAVIDRRYSQNPLTFPAFL